VALSPDGRFVAVGLSDGKVHFWQVSDGGYVTTITTGLIRLEQMVFSPNGRLLAVTSADPGVRVWQVSDGALLYTLEEGLQGPLNLAFSADARTLAAIDSQTIRFYGLDSGALARLIEIPSDAGSILLNVYTGSAPFGPRVAFSPDGQRLVLGSAVGPLLLFEVELGVLRRAQSAFTLPWCGLALSPNGGTVAVRTFLDDVISLWDVERAVLQDVLPAPAGCGLGAGTFSPDSRLLAVGSGEVVSLWHVDGTIDEQLGPYPEQMNPAALPEDMVHCAVFSPDGRWVAAISNAGRLQLWQRPEGELTWTTTMTSTALSSLCSLAFSPGGQYLATSGLGSPLSLWAIPEGTLVRQWDISQDEAMGGLAFSPGGQLLAAWTAAQEVSLWSLAGGEVVYTLTVPTEAGLGLTFSPDGSLLAGSSVEGPIYLWSVSEGVLLRVLEGHNTWVGGLAFSPDERLLFSASGDGTIRVWGVRSRKR
jgi:WD40 repeat protein